MHLDLLLAIAQISIAVSGLILSLTIWKASRRMSRAHYMRSVQDAWNTFNTVALSDERNLQAAEKLFELYGVKSSPEFGRTRWLFFITLNALQAEFIGMKYDLMEKTYAETGLQQLLRPLLRNDEFYQLTQSQGYDPDFRNLCKNQRDLITQEEQPIETAR